MILDNVDMSPQIAWTKSNLNIPTLPQFSAPMITKISARRSKKLI